MCPECFVSQKKKPPVLGSDLSSDLQKKHKDGKVHQLSMHVFLQNWPLRCGLKECHNAFFLVAQSSIGLAPSFLLVSKLLHLMNETCVALKAKAPFHLCIYLVSGIETISQ